MPSLNDPSKAGQGRKKRRSIGDDISHHRVDLPSSASGISVAAAELSAQPANQGADAPAAPAAVASREGALEAAKYARRTARSIGRHSTNFDPRKEIAIPRFLPDEIVLGSKLGRGGFSNVYEIVRFDLRKKANAGNSNGAATNQRPNILGEDGGDQMVGVPVGGALSDSHRELMARRRRSSSNRRRLSSQSGQSSRSGNGSHRDLNNDYDLEEEKGESDEEKKDGNNDDGDDDDDDDADNISEASSSDDEIPVDQLERICRRVSKTSLGSADGFSDHGSDSDDAGEVVHPILQRGGSTPHLFSNYHTEAREFLSQHCIRDAKSKNEPSTPRYAIKRLRADVMEDDDTYPMGAADLVVEARFLACLEHPNIVKIRGMTHGDCDAFASGVEGDYFLILDRLSESLTQRIEKWKREARLCKGKRSGMVFDRRGQKWNSLLAKRLDCGFEIANALKYLHSKNIIFRDLKPDNVGFDCRGDVKIFDFGLAKEMRDDERVDDPSSTHNNGRPRSAMAPGSSLRASARRKGTMFTDVFEMSAPCGSYRYMSPEVMLAKPYNFSADTYSFAVLLYEITMLKKPYANMGREELIEKVTVERYRPELPTEGRTVLPSSIRTYLSLAWSDNLRYRPTMEGTCGTLFKCLETLKGANDVDGNKRPSAYDRRRSTFVMRGASLRNLGFGAGAGSSRNLMGMGKIGSSRTLFKRGSSMDST